MVSGASQGPTRSRISHYAQDSGRLAEQNIALQRQIDNLRLEIGKAEAHVKELTEAKFVTFKTMIDAQADQVQLALQATTTAIDKAEIATQKAIEKAEIANDNRFASVNEFRAQLGDQSRTFATLERVDLLFNQLGQRFEEYKAGTEARLLEMVTRVTAMEAASRGAQGNKNANYAAIAAAVGLITIFIFVANILTKRG